MSRPYRLQGENCCYHITSRGDDRKKIFISDYDRRKFLEYLNTAKSKYKYYLYAYVLMDNHYHLLLETTQPNLSKIMHFVNSSYTTYYNIKRHRCGHVFQGRYKSILVDKDNYLLELTRYIHLNPVRAKMVPRPEDYPWSSYKGYLKKPGDTSIDREQINQYIALGPEKYQEFVEEGISKAIDPLKEVYGGFILGQTTFIKEKLKELKEQVAGGKEAIPSSIGIEEIGLVIAKEYGKELNELRPLKNRQTRERDIAIYLLQRVSALGTREIGSYFDISSSAVSKVTASVERQRQESKEFKKEIERLLSAFSA
jgi:REP element-mobilizing transposase RayT